MQVSTSLQTDTMPAPHHSVFYRPDALPAAQPTASKHWRLSDRGLYFTTCGWLSQSRSSRAASSRPARCRLSSSLSASASQPTTCARCNDRPSTWTSVTSSRWRRRRVPGRQPLQPTALPARSHAVHDDNSLREFTHPSTSLLIAAALLRLRLLAGFVCCPRRLSPRYFDFECRDPIYKISCDDLAIILFTITSRAYFSVYYYTKCVLLKAGRAALKTKMCNIKLLR